MFFFLSKIFWQLFAPQTFISVLICGGFLARRYKWGRFVMGTGITLLFLFGFLPLGPNLLTYQENQYPVLKELPANVDGVIVLGGAIELQTSQAVGQGQLNDRAARMTEMVFLMRQYPHAKIVFSGGNGRLEKSSSSESKEVDNLFKHMGIDTSRIIYEDESRNTYENMEFSKAKLNPKKGETWLLVTSAFHMKRSEEIFNSNGWDVIPYPAGYLTEGEYKLIPNLDVHENMYKLQIAVREMIGIMAYTLTGKIKSNEVTNPVSMPAGSAGH